MAEETQEELMERVKNMSPEELLEFQKSRCIFCQIISGKVQSKKVYEDNLIYVILDINPANPGHVLVMPKEHYSIMPQVPEEVLKHLFIVVKKLSQVALKTLGARGTNILVQNGVAAGQKSQHFMVHLIPRKENDGLPFKLEKQDISDTDYNTVKERMQKKVNEIFGIKDNEAAQGEKGAEETKEAATLAIENKKEAKSEEKSVEETKEKVKPAEETKEEIKEAEFEEEKEDSEQEENKDKEKPEGEEEIKETNKEVKNLNKDIEELQNALGDEVDNDDDDEVEKDSDAVEEDNDVDENSDNDYSEEEVDKDDDEEIDDDSDEEDNDNDNNKDDSEYSELDEDNDNSDEDNDNSDENDKGKDDNGANLDDISKLFG